MISFEKKAAPRLRRRMQRAIASNKSEARSTDVVFGDADLTLMADVLEDVCAQRHITAGSEKRTTPAERGLLLYANGTRDPLALKAVLMRCRF